MLERASPHVGNRHLTPNTKAVLGQLSSNLRQVAAAHCAKRNKPLILIGNGAVSRPKSRHPAWVMEGNGAFRDDSAHEAQGNSHV
jgi:hypothetical protein